MAVARVDQLPIIVPAAIATAWIALLVIGADVGAVTYAIPLLFVAAGTAAAITVRVVPPHARMTVLVYVFALFALNLNFRQRELGLTGLDWQNGAKLVVWSGILVMAWVRRSLILRFLREPSVSLATIYTGFALISTSWSETPAYTGASAVGLIAYLMLACIAVADVGSQLALRLALWTLTAYVALGAIGAFIAPDVAWLAPSAEETVYRLQGFSGHPNVFAQQIGILIMVLAVARRSKLIGFLPFLMLLALAAASIGATGSRTTIAAVTVAWAFIALRNRHCLPIVLVTAMLASAGILMAAALGALSDMDAWIAELSRTGTASEIVTLTGRTEVWSVVWFLIQERPFLGWGYNGTEDLISGSMHASFAGTAVNAHNFVLQSLVSVGSIGTLPLLALGALLVLRFFRSPDSDRDQFMIFTFCVGVGEVAISASPVLLNLMVFLFLAREAEVDFLQAQAHLHELRRTPHSAWYLG